MYQKRCLSIHEYLSANLLKTVRVRQQFPYFQKLTIEQYGVGVPKGEVARSAAEAEKIATEIGMHS